MGEGPQGNGGWGRDGKLRVVPLFLLVVGQLGYPWGPSPEAQPLVERLGLPEGSRRAPVEGFGRWLLELPTRPGRPAVHLWDGRLKARQDVHALVVDLDVGQSDLQQCADAVMRLRAEYLWAAGRPEAICFRFTSGDPVPWRRWAAGERWRVRGAQVTHAIEATADGSRANFRRYLETVFTYAGTRSLVRELQPIPAEQVAPGDVWIQGGSPGHAVIVLDVARTDERIFMVLAQSYMPAQEVHVLADGRGSPWFELRPGAGLHTPEWDFERGDLYRFQELGCPPARLRGPTG